MKPNASDQPATRKGLRVQRLVRLFVIQEHVSNCVKVYITGRFTPTNPPRPKVGPIETAKKWKTRKGAEAWNKRHTRQYGLRVVRLPNAQGD